MKVQLYSTVRECPVPPIVEETPFPYETALACCQKCGHRYLDVFLGCQFSSVDGYVPPVVCLEWKMLSLDIRICSGAAAHWYSDVFVVVLWTSQSIVSVLSMA